MTTTAAALFVLVSILGSPAIPTQNHQIMDIYGPFTKSVCEKARSDYLDWLRAEAIPHTVIDLVCFPLSDAYRQL